MISFEIDTTPEKTDQILESLKVISHATSLGGVESLIERRTRYEAEREAGVPMTLCRFSVGIESVEDLWSDLETALSLIE
jgi:cystathionine gamma-synthase